MQDQQTAEQRTGERIRDRRLSHGLSQRDLADAMSAIGFSWQQTTVAKTEAAERPIRVNELVALADIFDVAPGDLADPGGGSGVALREMVRANARRNEIERDIARVQQQLDELKTERKKWAQAYQKYSAEYERTRHGKH